ncbi:MAG: hypothetical protein P8Y03_10885 [Anaerolineales bacterium]|jgi:hypothetical protein
MKPVAKTSSSSWKRGAGFLDLENPLGLCGQADPVALEDLDLVELPGGDAQNLWRLSDNMGMARD